MKRRPRPNRRRKTLVCLPSVFWLGGIMTRSSYHFRGIFVQRFGIFKLLSILFVRLWMLCNNFLSLRVSRASRYFCNWIVAKEEEKINWMFNCKDDFIFLHSYVSVKWCQAKLTNLILKTATFLSENCWKLVKKPISNPGTRIPWAVSVLCFNFDCIIFNNSVDETIILWSDL